MPASMTGYLMPSSLQSGVCKGGGDDMLTEREEGQVKPDSGG